MSIILKKISYLHPNNEPLFRDISFSISKGQKVALIGNNGSGKSTLMKIITRNIRPSCGEISLSGEPYYVPQYFEQYGHLTVAQTLQVDIKLEALDAILSGDVSAERLIVLNEDWDVEKHALAALGFWGLNKIKLTDKMKNLSSGEKTKVFLSGIILHSPIIILLDDPSNHLDLHSKKKLYKYIQCAKSTMLIATHDRTLIDMLETSIELDSINL